MSKNLSWRIQGIDASVTKEHVLDFFEEFEQHRISVKTLCPSVDNPRQELTATIDYKHDLDSLDHIPRLRDDIRDELEFDRHFRGFTPLHSPAAGTHDADIIAVTRLGGHAIASWSLPNGKMWLRDYVPSSAPTARILTYGYPNQLEGSNLSNSTLRDLASEFLNNLVIIRNRTAQGVQRPMILVGHCLGGLIIKMALIQARELNIISKLPVRLFIFLATPHRGMNVDALKTIKDDQLKKLVEELEPNSAILRSMHAPFSKLSDKIRIFSVFETQRTAPLVFDESRGRLVRSDKPVILVEYESAIQGRENETVMQASTDHHDIAKLAPWQGSIYPMVREMIEQTLASSVQVKGTSDPNERRQTEPLHTAAIPDQQSRLKALDFADGLVITTNPTVGNVLRDGDRSSLTDATNPVAENSKSPRLSRHGNPFGRLLYVYETTIGSGDAAQPRSPGKSSKDLSEADRSRRKHRFQEWGR
ncbi:uncharacterized protein K489DRAFT_374466 [Dissoconium aciculare CBS 342.82]|uniref:DUF676 domain-containing protein n=1 Tax=Dissoconium aciculare CBS 342.82 TaxID=1314786 RepID=A0A6J3LQZ7_9PEZI|nr:uncharacterized protein K489DRAFT_374466 [Dissoconium aciculare CBS 342.82]KAF1818286.1 hypothetical protein K489DRAFT_374466 [Dissoconium aciculare CBS 342.82]